MGIQIALAFVSVLASVAMFFLTRREIRLSRKETMAELRDLVRKGHGDPCPGTAVVVPSPSPAPVEEGPTEEPAPVVTRNALLPDERVEVARDGRTAVTTSKLPSAQAEEDDGDGDRATPEEGTRVWTGKRTKRPTLLSGLAGSPQGDERSSDTLVSAGVKLPEDPDDGSVVMEAQHWDGTPLSNRRGPASSER
jgi:hypothetical protein